MPLKYIREEADERPATCRAGTPVVMLRRFDDGRALAGTPREADRGLYEPTGETAPDGSAVLQRHLGCAPCDAADALTRSRPPTPARPGSFESAETRRVRHGLHPDPDPAAPPVGSHLP